MGRSRSINRHHVGKIAHRELLAVEWNDHAVETFRLNFPDVPVWHGDIAQLSVEECHEMIDLVFALGGHHKVELFLEE